MLNLHGVLLGIHDKGVLLMGSPSVGKSENALALLYRGHQFIADDAPLFYKRNAKWVGHASATQKGIMCVRSLGLIDVEQLFGKNALRDEIALELIITLDNAYHPIAPQRLEIELVNKIFHDITVPCLSLPIASSHNVAILIESAVKLAFMPKSARIEKILTT